jgi:hypothetical protein
VMGGDAPPQRSGDRWEGYVDRLHPSPANELRIRVALDRAFRLRDGEPRPYVVYCDLDRCAMTVTDRQKRWWFQNIQRDLETQGLFDGLVIGSEGALFTMNEPGVAAVYQAQVQLDDAYRNSFALAECTTGDSKPRRVRFNTRPNLATHHWIVTTTDEDATTPFGVCARRVLDNVVATHPIPAAATWAPILSIYALNDSRLR